MSTGYRANTDKGYAKVPDNHIQYGDLFMDVRFTGFGSEQDGSRPCIVVSNNACNTFSPVITVVPLSSQEKPFLPTHVLLPMRLSGLPKDSVVLCEQVISIDKMRLGYKVGRLPKHIMQNINKSLQVQLNMIPSPKRK